MLFNSWIFAIFFAVVLAGHVALARTRFRLPWLLAASWIFYGWLNPLYVALIAYTTAVNYLCGIRIERSRARSWLAVAVANNILILGFFKYAGFVAENINSVLGLVSPDLLIPIPGKLLPIGLSFYTFIATGYIIDVWRGEIDAERNPIRFASFIAFFPYLLAGPIERAGNMLPQLSSPPGQRIENITEGMSLFVTGLFKKIALADFLALYANRVFGEPAEYGAVTSLVATYAYAWQIYFDFSGYTDMARGCARMMGYNLMLNFNNPYLSASLGEFWQRWHISLSSWFKDYLYIPLGGNRRGHAKTYRNMILTMLAAGLWHGAAWNFVIWGGLHAIGRSVTRELEATRFYAEKIPRWVKQLFVFHFVCLTWVFFRAETFGEALTVIGNILSFRLDDPLFPIVGILFIVAVWAYQFAFESRFKKMLESAAVKVGLMAAMILYMIFFRTSGYEVFLYFQF